MNKLTIIGNLVRTPETRTTQSGKTVCTFTVAVNRRSKDQQEADYFRVAAWGKLGESCQAFLDKGRKVAVTGSVSVSTYTAQNGENRASLEVFAEDVEFLTPKSEGGNMTANNASKSGSSWSEVTDEELPF